MKAIAYSPGRRELRIVERPEPAVMAGDQVKILVSRVGVCGTDRERIAEGKAPPPEGYDDLVIGHESFGRVVEVVLSLRAPQTRGALRETKNFWKEFERTFL
ncbi:MAG: alcohol dehydrogenase catalytic domain-containing protein [Deltaproteobacteria bacterium]|nr:alcohol dehydrogenase catalytic domain-containing protein [Deltaproteobacteria bacterium]MCL4873989.1 alcohol dehydrogenase catalytic domain-containing protein [bacterium]